MSVWIAVGVFLFLALRILAILAIPPIFDEMVQLYMARDIAHFLNFPIYFYGQQYMGPIESYFLAPFLRWFGFSYLTGRFFYQFFYLTFIAIYLGVVRRLFDRELTVYLFFLLCVLPYPALHFTSIVAYGEILTLAMLCLALLLRRSFFWLGFVSGLAFWCNGIFVVWFVPIAIGLGGMAPAGGKRRALWWFGVGFLIGLFPIWIHGLQTGTLLSLKGGGGRFADWQDVPHLFYLFFARMKYFLSTNLYEPQSLFARQMIRYLSLFPFSLFMLSLGAVTLSFFRSFRRQTAEQKAFHLFIILPPLILMMLYSLRNLTEDEGIRFFLPLLTSYPFTVSWWVQGFASRWGKQVILISLTGTLLAASFVSLKSQSRERSELMEMVRILEQNQVSHGIGGMAVAYTLNGLSHDRIVTTPILSEARYHPIWSLVKEKGPRFFIAERGADPALERRIQAEPGLTKVSVGRYDIFYGLSPILQDLLEGRYPS